MTGRRSLFALVALAALLHATAIARTWLPAQDGLKFLRTARQFQVRPWADVVRGSDQHPLYPALVAVAEPVVAALTGPGPEAWRITGQLVAALGALGLIAPLYGLTRTLFDERIAWVAVLIYVVLPLPAAVGHDTLSDSVALFAALSALRLGEIALRTGGWASALGCALVAGVGYMARPEVVVVPVSVVLTAASYWQWRSLPRVAVVRVSALAVVFLATVGCYALVKGAVSEKLALRMGAALGHRPVMVRQKGQWLPRGLDDPRWDFSPKEESEEPAYSSLASTAGTLLAHWAEGLCGIFAFFTIWGIARDRYIRTLCTSTSAEESVPPGSRPGRRLIAIYLGLFSLILIRHALRMGYLSDRHTLTLIVCSIPWAAAGTLVCARGLALKLRWGSRVARAAGVTAVLALMGAGITLQAKPPHPSRWGHWAAGRWLAAQTSPADAVLDTRGWASFVSGRPSYDYWHVRQAFTDSHLAYVVVGSGELTAQSRRAATLRAVLAYAATPVAGFPAFHGGQDTAVRIYRYRRPASWEGLRE